jgi:hypothetical protein
MNSQYNFVELVPSRGVSWEVSHTVGAWNTLAVLFTPTSEGLWNTLAVLFAPASEGLWNTLAVLFTPTSEGHPLRVD